MLCIDDIFYYELFIVNCVQEFSLCKYGIEIIWAKVASIRDKHFDPL